jgi:hypothetical protein
MIAGRLDLSIKTIESHRELIKIKLGLKAASELVNYAFNWLHETAGPVTNPPRPGSAGVRRQSFR